MEKRVNITSFLRGLIATAVRKQSTTTYEYPDAHISALNQDIFMK